MFRLAEIYESVFANEEEESVLPEDRKYKASFKKRLVFSVIFTTLAVAFSFFSIIDANVENTLMPVHIPVLLGSFVCGGPLGFFIGLAAPLLKFLLFSSPAPLSDVVCCSFELAVCGCFGGYLFRSLPAKLPFYALNTAISLLAAKTTYFVLKYLITIFFAGTDLAPEVFISNHLIPALVGIAFQSVVIPIVVVVFKKAKIAFNN